MPGRGRTPTGPAQTLLGLQPAIIHVGTNNIIYISRQVIGRVLARVKSLLLYG